jgi:DNA polymerase III subunit delta
MAEEIPAATVEKPVVILLHGDDTYAIQKTIAGMQAKIGDPSMAELNTTQLDGRQVDEDDIRSAAFAMPFLTERRLVVVTDPLARLSNKGASEAKTGEKKGANQLSASQRSAREKFLTVLNAVPPTTALVLVANDSRIKRKGEWQWEVLTPSHWLIRWMDQAGKRAWVQEFSLPTLEEMPVWIRKQADSLGGQFSPQAARALAEYLGPDTQMAAQEITKLLTYVNWERPVEEDDVALMTVRSSQTSVFTLVDAIGERNGHQASQMLHMLMEENEPADLFGMIVRQFRLLLQAREVIDEGGGVEIIAREVKEKSGGALHPYVAQKLTGQVQRYSLTRLEEIYRRLLEIDLDLKTSRTSPEVAFDLLIAELSI